VCFKEGGSLAVDLLGNYYESHHKVDLVNNTWFRPVTCLCVDEAGEKSDNG